IDARRTARAALAANRPLDQLDVSITPLLKALIEVGHQLEQDLQIWTIFVEKQQSRLQDFVRLGRQGDVALAQGWRDGDTVLLQKVIKAIVNRGTAQPALEAIESRGVVLLIAQNVGALVTEQELQLAELHRLKPGRGLQPIAEAVELEGG